MKLLSALLLSAALMIAAPAAFAGDHAKNKQPAEQVTAMKDGSYKVVTWEGNRKITTVYKPVGQRKVGLVGNEPFPVRSGRGLQDGGQYYTENGVKYFRPTKTLDVEYTGQLNSNK